MTEKIALRDYQRELAERLRSAGAGRVASLLGVQIADESWLVDLAEAGEVVPVPPITALPLTRAWFKGLANVRGKLYSVIDFPAFLERRPVSLGDQSRLLLISDRFRLGAALLVDRALGLRNPDQLTPAEAERSPWARKQYADADGRRWKELDLSQLVQHPDFLHVAM